MTYVSSPKQSNKSSSTMASSKTKTSPEGSSRRSPISKLYASKRRKSVEATIVGYVESSILENSPNGIKLPQNEPTPPSKASLAATEVTSPLTVAIQRASRPSHSARLALACIKGAISRGMSVRTALCPVKMRQRLLRRYSSPSGSDEDEYEEEPSSGDEEEEEFLDAAALYSSEGGLENPIGGPSIRAASNITERSDSPYPDSKLAFGQRKIKFFDSVVATERDAARKWLREEYRSLRKRDRELLGNHLKRQQCGTNQEMRPDNNLRDVEGIFLPQGVSMGMSAALILESLAMNQIESLEGMSKCYDGLVAAGTALLEEEEKGGGVGRKGRNGGEVGLKVLEAVRSLLITTLEEKSGEAIVGLSRLISMCGTARYRRRFVQRVAPYLVRVPDSAMWCLKHKNDMTAIVAAVELVLDAAGDLFSHGWYVRGRQVLADGRRMEFLESAEKQLLSLSDSAVNSAKHRRGSSFYSGKNGTIPNNPTPNQGLVEWEVLAVDRQIRKSIGNLFTKDWSRVISAPHSNTSNLAPNSLRSAGIRATTNNSISNLCPMSPRSLKIPLSPHHPNIHPPTPTSTTTNTCIESTNYLPPPISPCKSPTPDKKTHESLLYQEIPLKTPLTPKQAKTTINSSTSQTIIGTPPRSPSSPPRGPRVSTSNLLISTAPQMPLIQSTTPPAAPLSPSPSNNSLSSNTSYYRALTGNAAERKRTVAACRALRAQITRYEESFIKFHGRPPKGAAERAPLATTYAQYRDWKRAIRADAACRIQALVRGAQSRERLLNCGDPKLIQIVRKNSKQRSALLDLAIPVEIVATEVPSDTVKAEEDANEEFETVISPTNDNSNEEIKSWAVTPPAAPPGRPNSKKYPKPTGRQTDGNGFTNNTEESPYTNHPRHNPPNAQTIHSPPPPNMENLSLPDLQAKKRDLKNRLKQYDMDFARQHHGRMPVKAEKEPIRHLYEQYNTLKSYITSLERGGYQSESTDSSTNGSGNPRPRRPGYTSDSSESSDNGRGGPPSIAIRRTTTANPPGIPDDLASLRTEKQKLHQMLRTYERDFYREHRRQVSSFTDIRPVAAQYRRYKEIKRAIQMLQSQGSS